MFYAINNEEDKIQPYPKGMALCPICKSKVIAKCGDINIWHWAHESLIDCDEWAEPDTEWHSSWKELIKKDYCEVTISNHRADIFIPFYKRIIELQNSHIAPKEIIEREQFYKNMIWLFNGIEFYDNLDFRDNGNYFSFRWKHPRKSQFCITKPLFWDFGNSIFKVKKIYNHIPCGGWGVFLKRKTFINTYMWLVKRKK